MDELVDARGLACPEPVVRTRDALKGGAKELEVLVDNATARDNVCRFASSRGCRVEVAGEGDGFRIEITRGEETEASAEAGGRSVVVLSEDSMGHGNRELGGILIRAFLNTLAESDPPPWRIILFNSGVKLAVEGADTVQAIGNLERLGVEVLVCGTCLDFFGLKEKLAAGTVSNMYDILDSMLSATTCVSL